MAPRGLISHRALQGLVKIGDQIIDMFDANGQSHQPVVNADCGSLLGGDGRMSHEGWMLDEAFNAAEAFGQGENVARLQKSP